MSKRPLLWATPLALVLLSCAWYLFAARHTPRGQPPLAYLEQDSIAAFHADFNRHADKVRIILLLSPT